MFSRSLGESHQKTLNSVIEEVALFYRKRIRIRQQRIASLAHQVLGAEADISLIIEVCLASNAWITATNSKKRSASYLP